MTILSNVDRLLSKYLPKYPERVVCHYPLEDAESDFNMTYSQCAASMERLFSGVAVSDTEFILIGDSWSLLEGLFIRKLLVKGYIIQNPN